MAKWVLSRPGVWEYPSLGFRAPNGAILDAQAPPDQFWSLNGDQGAAETVVRHTLGDLDQEIGGVPAQMAQDDWIDGGTPTSTAFDDFDGGTP